MTTYNLNAVQERKVEVLSIVDSILFKAAKRAYLASKSKNNRLNKKEHNVVRVTFLILDDLRDMYSPEVAMAFFEADPTAKPEDLKQIRVAYF